MSLRLFAAIPVPEEIGRDYLRLQKGVPGARWRPLENFHITLRFFGEMDERQAEDLDAELVPENTGIFEKRLAAMKRVNVSAANADASDTYQSFPRAFLGFAFFYDTELARRF